MASLLQHVGLKRRVTITAPVPMMQASQNLKAALAEDIMLSGSWQLTRRYWGHFSYPDLTLHGPRANRQFCFLTQGQLQRGSDREQTTLDISITLGQASEAQLLWLLVMLPILLGVVLRWFGLFLLPLFLGFFYSMTQWHFSHYTTEIRMLLKDLMVGDEKESGPFTSELL